MGRSREQTFFLKPNIGSKQTDRYQRLSLQTRYVKPFIRRPLFIPYPSQFQAEGSEGHSSSIVDLFDSLRSPIDFLQDLEWDDDYQNARFFTSLSKVCSVIIDVFKT